MLSLRVDVLLYVGGNPRDPPSTKMPQYAWQDLVNVGSKIGI